MTDQTRGIRSAAPQRHARTICCPVCGQTNKSRRKTGRGNALSSSYYSQETHGPYHIFKAGDFDLESGARLRNLEIAYSTIGDLSAAKDNVILFPTWYSGTSKILEQAYVGPGRALDPEKHFIIFVNQIGNGLSSAPHSASPPFNGARFPHIAIADDVRAQHQLVTDVFGISKLQLVLGGSMGAQQTYEWAVRFPEVVERAAPIAGMAKCTAHNKLLVETFMEAITGDGGWQDGWYENAAAVHLGLRRHAKLFATHGFTPNLFNTEDWRRLGFASVEDFVTGFVEGHFVPQDPNNLLTLLAKWHGGDVSKITDGDLMAALSRITAKTFVIAIEEDSFFPLHHIAAEQKLIPNSELKVVSSQWGHLALFGVDPHYNAAIDTHLKELLAA